MAGREGRWLVVYLAGMSSGVGMACLVAPLLLLKIAVATFMAAWMIGIWMKRAHR